MTTSLHISFQLKKSRLDAKSQAPIFARLTINHQRCEFSIKRSIEPAKWIAQAGMAKGTTEEVRNLNAYLTTVRLNILEHHRKLIEAGKMPSVEDVRNAYFGITERGKTILQVFEYHNNQMKALEGKDYSAGTIERYNTAYTHIKNFIEWQYRVSDLELKAIDYAFITEFEFYLKTVRKCNHNSAIKYITNFKKIVRICLGNRWLQSDPFINYRITLREVEREFLTEEEIQAIASKEFSTDRLENVRDVFLFCCFTGLAYADAKKLSKEHLIMGIDGERWIKINRTKTDTRSNIPLLPMAATIIEKYRQNPECQAKGKLLPVLSNQKMNTYLKEIADVCAIRKNITFHLARHSFATTVTLTNGVPIESVSKMLGHKSLRTTQHYAKIVDRKVSDDMAILKQKFSSDKIANKKAAGY
jgi:site-specific recombinase XerD